MKLARVTKVYRDSSQERTATEYNGSYAVDVTILDSKLADTDESISSVFLTMQTEDDYSYPDEGSIVGIDIYEGTSIYFVDHITPFGKLVPGLQAGQRQIGDEQSRIAIDTDQSSIEIEADNVRIEGDEFKNTASSQENITDQYGVESGFLINLASKGDINLGALGIMNFQAGRFSITGTENSTITAVQALNIVTGLVFQIVTGGNFSVVSQLGSVEVGNLIGKTGVDATGLLVAENLTTDLKTIVSGIIDEVSKIIVANGTGPDAGALTLLKSQMALLYK